MKPVALRAAYGFDGEAAIDRPQIVIEAGRITSVGSHASEVPEGADLIDFGEATLLPGLVDPHVHLVFAGTADPVAILERTEDEALIDMMRRNAKAALDAGITTIRDLGDRNFLSLALREEFAADATAGPRLLCAGPPLTVTDGHCHYLGGVVDGPDEARRAVRRRSELGVDVIKVMVTGGELTPITDPLQTYVSDDMLSAIVDEAHACGLTVTGHAHSAAGIATAVASGVDGVEHGLFRVRDGDGERLDAPPEILDTMAERGVWICRTGGVTPGGEDPAPRIMALLGAMGPLADTIHRAGVTLVAGSDAGISGRKPFDVFPHTIASLAPSLGALGALAAGTSTAARVCGLSEKGVLAAGADGDVIAVRGNATVDPLALVDVVAVFRQGARVR
jgi:imidazolonepropionase-like amidohydrolase